MLVLTLAGITVCSTSCATLFGGKITECQKTKPAAGAPQRTLRIGALVADVLLFWPSLGVDFLTGAIYKPCGTEAKTKMR